MDDDRTSGGPALADRYELGAVLGRGGMGTVHDATDLRLGRAVAVKILRPELAEQPRARRRFETEARAAARLAHPNVVTVFDSGEDGAVPYLVMERLPGGTFADEIAAGPVPIARVRDVALDVLSALDAAHRAGIIHRDIKPGNLLIDDDAHVKVSDFGIAKTVDDVEQTQTMDLVATLAYLAPERLEGAPASERSDLYSLGVLLYEALGGQRPFKESTPLLEMRAIERGTPDELVSLRPELPRDLVDAIERAMARRPDDRFPSASAMAAALVPESDPKFEPTVPIAATSVADTEPVGRAVVPENATRPLPVHRAPTRSAEVDEPAGRTGVRRARVLVGTAVVVIVAATAVALAVRERWATVDAGNEPRHECRRSDHDPAACARGRSRPPGAGGGGLTIGRRAVVLSVAFAISVSACGGNSDDHLSNQARDRLERMTRGVRVAAASQNRLRTRRALDAVRREVVRDQRVGDIGGSRAKRLLADVAAVEARLVLLPPPTTTTTSTTTTSPPPHDEPGPGKGDGHGKGNKHGKDKKEDAEH